MLYDHISGFYHMVKRAQHVKRHGFHKYQGDAQQICEQIVNDCWNGEFFQTSAGHFSEFWSRDFGMCCQALLNLGYKNEVLSTLSYALNEFSKHGRVTTHIPQNGKPTDFPNMAADSLPFLLNSLRLSGARKLVNEHMDFLVSETDRYYAKVFDPKNALVKENKSFSSMKDMAKRNSATYDNSMLAMLRDDLTALGMPNPFSDYDVPDAIEQHLWNGSYFEEDLRKTGFVTGDANTYPFWCDVFGSKKMFQSCLKHIRLQELDKPWPLKYTAEPKPISKMVFIEQFSGGYERDAIWMHLGLCYVEVVRKFDKSAFLDYVTQLTTIIEQHHTFLEVYDRDGNPFHTFYYWTDEGMLWAAKYLDFLK